MKVSRLLQTVLFLTNPVFFVLFAYFDESMSSIGGYKPWRSCNRVDKHQYEFIMSSQQYLCGDLFSYTNRAYEFSVEFLCCEVFKFWVKF